MLKALSNDIFNHSLRKNICSVSRHLLKGLIFEHINVEHKERTKNIYFFAATLTFSLPSVALLQGASVALLQGASVALLRGASVALLRSSLARDGEA
jgi:hypothetical protein